MKAMKALVLVALATGCNWTEFGDLSDSTWVHAQETPDSNQSDYGVGVVGATTDGPGTLAVLSGSPANYSTLYFDASGSTDETLTEGLGELSITTLSTRPQFIGDGNGNVAIVDKGVDGPLVVIHGTAGQLTDSQLSSTNAVDAATFAGENIIVTSVGADPAANMAPDAFVVGATVTNCRLIDETGTPLAAAALTSDSNTLYAYGRNGTIYGYSLTLLSTCDNSQSPPILNPNDAVIATTAPALNGGYLALVGTPTKYVIAVAYDSASSTSGTVAVVEIDAGGSGGQVGTPLPMPGVRSAAFGSFGSTFALALGFPSRTVGTTEDAGQVEIHTFDPTTAAVNGDVQELLGIPQADTNLVFGRSLATMFYNDQLILVVGASNVVYAYYETALYADARQ